MLRRVRFTPGGPNEAWSLDFVADQLDEGRRVRALTLVNAVTPESRALEGGRSLWGEHVVMALIVFLTPCLDQPLRLLSRLEPMRIQAFLPKCPGERLHGGMVRGLAGS